MNRWAEAGIDYRPRPLKQITELLGPVERTPQGVVPTVQLRRGPETLFGDRSHAYAAISITGSSPRNR